MPTGLLPCLRPLRAAAVPVLLNGAFAFALSSATAVPSTPSSPTAPELPTVAAAGSLSVTANATCAPRTYTNPLTVTATVPPLPPSGGPRPLASRDYHGDPEVLRFGGRYYLYTTSSASSISFFGPGAALGVRCFSSADLVEWKDEGQVLDARDSERNPYTRNMIWSPQVIEAGGEFWLFYNAAGPAYEAERAKNMFASGSPWQRLCVARSKSPTGPFHEHAAPLLDGPQIPGWVDGTRGVIGCIDAFVFRDEARGRPPEYYLFWSAIDDETTRNLLWAGRLKPDFTGLLLPPEGPEPRLVLGEPMQEWERHACGGRLILEAPYVVRRGALYYLLYSANSFNTPDYAMGYGTSCSPLGPYRRAPENPFLAATGVDPKQPAYPIGEDAVAGPGSGSLVASPDGREMFLIYGALDVRTTAPACANGYGWVRRLHLDRVGWDDEGRLRVVGPTRSRPLAVPGGSGE